MEELSLVQLGSGDIAQVSRINGGEGVARRLEDLGIRPGKKITKLSAHFWQGPVMIQVGKTKVAVGHGMAKKIMVTR